MKSTESLEARSRGETDHIQLDSAIIGGGPAGCATALALIRHGFSVALLERSHYTETRVGETLPPSARKILTDLGVWDQFIAARHSPSFATRSAWGGPDVYENDFIFNPYGSGWHVERPRFDLMLAEAAATAGAILFRDAPLGYSIQNSAGEWRIEVAQGGHASELRTRFLIDATGRASLVSRKLGGRRKNYDHLVGIVGFYAPPFSHVPPGAYTLVEATENGWWYSAVLPDTRIVVAYMTDADLYARGTQTSSNYFSEQLSKTYHTYSRLDACVLTSPAQVCAAGSGHLDRISGRGWLAVGDAASTFDPLSSQGILKAMESGILAADAVRSWFRGDLNTLTRYDAAFRNDFRRYMQTRRDFYGKETRWNNSIFWKRRQVDGLLADS